MKKYAAAVLALVIAVFAAACTDSAAGMTTQTGADTGIIDESVNESPAGAEESKIKAESSSVVSKAQSAPESKTQSSAESKAQSSAESKAQSSAESKAQSSAESKAQSSAESKAQSSAESKVQSSAESSGEKETAQSPEKPKTAKASSVTLSDSDVTLTVGEKYTIYAYIHPENVDRTDLIWHWSDNSVISMNSDGVITAKAVGKVTITAETYNKKTAVCKVTVVEKPPEPSVIPEDQQIEYKPAPELSGAKVTSDWFDDAIFVGDSVTNGLCFYADSGSLGDADFLYAVSLGYNNAMWALDNKYAVHPKYNGKKVLVEDGVRMSGKKKVFIMLGMNDIGGYGVDGTISAMKKLTDRILRKSPDVQIYIESVTPLLKKMKRDDMLNNANVAKFNEKAKKVCAERGFVFVDVASAVSDGHGNLEYENCGDPDYMGLHFSYAGCKKWVEYLYSHVE